MIELAQTTNDNIKLYLFRVVSKTTRTSVCKLNSNTHILTGQLIHASVFNQTFEFTACFNSIKL